MYVNKWYLVTHQLNCFESNWFEKYILLTSVTHFIEWKYQKCGSIYKETVRAWQPVSVLYEECESHRWSSFEHIENSFLVSAIIQCLSSTPYCNRAIIKSIAVREGIIACGRKCFCCRCSNSNIRNWRRP